MGADIYLQSRYDANEAIWRPKFDAAVEARNSVYPRGAAMPEDCPEQKAVDEAYERLYAVGYYRDSYNSTSLFGLLNLSWWRSCDDDSGYGWSIDDDGEMPIQSMVALQRHLEEHEITDAHMAEWARDNRGNAKIDDGENSIAEWKAMFERKRARLLTLLSEAIALNEPLRCSV